MAERKKFSKNAVFAVFGGLVIILFTMGILLSGYASANGSFGAPNLKALMDGYKVMITHPSLLDFDALKQAGQLGSGFFNSAILLTIVLLIYKITDTDIQGVQIAAAMMVLGFSFYGKNILNIWFPIIGVFLHTKICKKPFKANTALAFFSTALSPVFSQLAFGMTDKYMLEQVGLVPATAAAYILGGLMGILGGFLVSILSGYLPSIHQGFVLFNAGYAAGIAGFLINSLLKAIGFGHESYRAALYPTTMEAAQSGALPNLFDNAPHAAQALADPTFNPSYMSAADNGNPVLGTMLLICFLYLIVAGFMLGGRKEIKQMLWIREKGGNHIEKFGLGSTLINMGFIGLIATAFVFLTVKGQLAGPVFGCIWTAVGFAANGVTTRMYLPTMVGVFVGAFLFAGIGAAMTGGDFFTAGLTFASSRSMLLAVIFSCGLAPIAGIYGVFAGMFVGGIHSILVVNIGILHGFMSLYNNGFSLSLIATFLYPIYSKIGGKKLKLKESE